MHLLLSILRLGCYAMVLIAGTFVLAQSTPNERQAATLGLPRLAELNASKYTKDALSAQGVTGARQGDKRGAKFLALTTDREWSRPLRGSAKDLVFVSFAIYGSIGTIVETGGARVGIVDSDIDGYAQLAVDENSKWRLLGIHVPLQKFDRELLGAFPVLTVRLDRADGSWDLYYNARLVAEDLPLDASIKHGQFRVRAGEAGAMINGLVQSDENPLYADANGNGVDDDYEEQKMRRLLAADDSRAARKYLIAEWRKDQRTTPPPALFVNLPQPD